MINSLQLFFLYREAWGYFDAHVNPLFAPIDHNPCYKVKYCEVPDLSQQALNPGDYIQYTLRLKPGSLIIGFLNDDNTPLFSWQITDISTGHKFNDEPVSNVFLTNDHVYPSLLNGPYPVVGGGLFNCEFWAIPDPGVPPGAFLYGYTLIVAEVTEECR